jgi:hypothetical protein
VEEEASQREADAVEADEVLLTEQEEKEEHQLDTESLSIAAETVPAEQDANLPALAQMVQPLPVQPPTDSTNLLLQFKPTQQKLARRLVDVIDALYSKEEFSRFRKVEFRIFVPIFNQLVLQTLARVISSKLAPDECKLELESSKRVFSYHMRNANEDDPQSHLSKLRRQVRE